MSSTYGFPTGVALWGGIPTSLDTAPSIIFAVAYGLVMPLAIFRMVSSSSRSWILIRPILYVLAHVGAYIVRAYSATQSDYSTSIFIAELVMLIVGVNIILEASSVLLQKHLDYSSRKSGREQPPILHTVIRLMRLAAIASLVVGIVSSTLYGNTTDYDELRTLRIVSSAITLAVFCLTALIAAVLYVPLQCSTAGTAFIVGNSICLIIASAYRLYVVNQTDQDPLSTAAKVEFYVLGAFFEFWPAVAYFAFNLVELFDLSFKDPNQHGRFSGVFGGRDGQRFGSYRSDAGSDIEKQVPRREAPYMGKSTVGDL